MIILDLNILHLIAHLFQCDYHIVDFDTIYKICAVSQAGLDTIEFLIKFFEVGEATEVDALEVLSHVLILDEEFDDVEAHGDLIGTGCWLFEPFL